jgi:hypothetical protein
MLDYQTPRNLEESQKILHMLGVPELPAKKPCKKKRSWNREDVMFSEKTYPTKETIDNYEKIAKDCGTKLQAKKFLSLLYNDEDYKLLFSGEAVKKGANGKNWKQEGEWISPSLEYAYKISQAIGKTSWIKHGKHGKQSAAPDENRCQMITSSGNQCKRSISISLGGCYCTQHHR